MMRCGTIGSCQSAATSEIVKALLVTSLTHVSGAITSVQTFTFIFMGIGRNWKAESHAAHLYCKLFKSSRDSTSAQKFFAERVVRSFLPFGLNIDISGPRQNVLNVQGVLASLAKIGRSLYEKCFKLS